MVIGGIYSTLVRYTEFTTSNPHATEPVVYYLSQIRVLPRWQYPFAVLSSRVWAAVGGAMLCLGTYTEMRDASEMRLKCNRKQPKKCPKLQLKCQETL